jgi:tRNA modification GTPase
MTQDTIVALATPPGSGAIAVVRISGPKAHQIAGKFFRPLLKKGLEEGRIVDQLATNSVTLGHIYDGDKILDEVLLTKFSAPRSYTGEDVIEISCHGSNFIQQQLINLCLANGARMAEAGEFTLQAFLNGKMDLAQAEAVADLIASESAASHQIAIQQMRGGFTDQLSELRKQLLNYLSLIELELDFSEEDVDFADRTQLNELIAQLETYLRQLIDSFAMGNVLKSGIPVAIVGRPNVGKSTLLNALLNEERAIVSDVAGTTRDSIEDEINIEGVRFRFIDTAGIRQTQDKVESIGIQRTFEKIEKSRLVLMLFDAGKVDLADVSQQVHEVQERFVEKPLVIVLNKMDSVSLSRKQQIQDYIDQELPNEVVILLSAKEREGVQQLQESLIRIFNTGLLSGDAALVSNARHFAALKTAHQSLQEATHGLQAGISSEFVATDLRKVAEQIGLITGEITNDEVLGNIFANFCIGK